MLDSGQHGGTLQDGFQQFFLLKSIGFLHYSFDIRQSSFIAGFQPEKSYSSGITLKTDGHRFSFDNDRHFACSFGVFQHGFKMPGFFYHIIIIDLPAVFGKCCTSCPGIRSGILPENQDIIRHFSLLPVWRLWF